MEEPVRFWQGMNKATLVGLLDKIMIGVNADGSTKYTDINQLANLLTTASGTAFEPVMVTDGSVLPVLETPKFLFAGAGTFTKPGGGTLTTTENFNVLSYDGTKWVNILSVPVSVDLNKYAKPSGLSCIQGGVKVTPDQSLFPNPAWSIEMFIQLHDVTSTQMILENGTGKPSLYLAAGKITVAKSQVITSGTFDVSTFLNKDAFISITFDGTIHKVKINDVLVPFTVTNANNTYTTIAEPLYIGSSNGASLFANMDVYSVRVFNRVLSDNEITAHYNKGIPQFYSVAKDNTLLVELLGDNALNQQWYDSSLAGLKGLVHGNVKSFSSTPIMPKVVERDKVFKSGISFTQGNVAVAPASSLFPNSAWSIEIFINARDITTVQTIFENGTGKPLFLFNAGELYIAKAGVVSVLKMNATPFLNKPTFLTVTFNGTIHKVYLNGIETTFTLLNGSAYTNEINNMNLGSYGGSIQWLNAEVYLFRVFSRAITSTEVLNHYNDGLPGLVRLVKESTIRLELHGDNAGSVKWYDTSVNILKGLVAGSAAPLSISPTLEDITQLSTLLSVLPSHIYVAVGREFNLWYDAIVPNYGKEVRINVFCSKGFSRERSFRYTPTVAENLGMTIQVRNLKGEIIEAKTLTLHGVAKNAGSGTKQILFIGDSTTDSYNATDYPVLPSGRGRFEMLNEINTLLTADGGITPLFLGLRGVAPYKHQAHSGYSTDLFLTNNVTYTNPFWDAGGNRVNFKKYMADNVYFGGSDRIDFAFIQLGINDLKYPNSPATVLANIKTLIAKILDATYGYPDCKIIVSLSPYAGVTRDGWALHFTANSDYDVYVSNMIKYAKLLVAEFDSNPANPNVYISPNMLFVDRKHGYPYELTNVSARSTVQENEYTDSVHPSASGYKQAADAYYSRLRSLL